MIQVLLIFLGGQPMKLDQPIVFIEPKEPKEPNWEEIIEQWEKIVNQPPITVENLFEFSQLVQGFSKNTTLPPQGYRPLLRPNHHSLGLQIYTSRGGMGN